MQWFVIFFSSYLPTSTYYVQSIVMLAMDLAPAPVQTNLLNFYIRNVWENLATMPVNVVEKEAWNVTTLGQVLQPGQKYLKFSLRN